jgi:hypothetical protein
MLDEIVQDNRQHDPGVTGQDHRGQHESRAIVGQPQAEHQRGSLALIRLQQSGDPPSARETKGAHPPDASQDYGQKVPVRVGYRLRKGNRRIGVNSTAIDSRH